MNTKKTTPTKKANDVLVLEQENSPISENKKQLALLEPEPPQVFPPSIREFFDLESLSVMESNNYIKNGIPLPNCTHFLQPLFADIAGSNLNDVRLMIRGTKPTEIGKDDEIIQSFPRVSLNYEISDNEEFSMQIGFVYALDMAQPIIKVFSGVKVHACTNMCIFGAQDHQKYNILTNMAGAYDMFNKYLTNARQKYENYKTLIHEMKNTFIAFENLHKFYGTLLQRFTAVKNIAGSNVITNSFQLLQKKDSPYYVPEFTNCTVWNLYNSLTDDYFGYKQTGKGDFGKTDLIDQPEKVYSLFSECELFQKGHPKLFHGVNS